MEKRGRKKICRKNQQKAGRDHEKHTDFLCVIGVSEEEKREN